MLGAVRREGSLSAWARIGFWVAVSLIAQGCGGSGTSISISPKSLAFVVSGGATNTQSKTVTTTFRGDGVVAGYAAGVTPASWLTVDQSSLTTSTTASFTLTANAGPMAAGTYMTSLRFATGRLPPGGMLSQATQVTSVDLPVTLTVTDFGVSPSSIALTAINGSNAAPTPTDARMFKISGASAQWTATSDSPWLTLVEASGNGPSDLHFTVTAAGLGAGSHTAQISVKDSASGATIVVTVSLMLAAPMLTTSSASLAFMIGGSSTAADLSQSFTVSDQLAGADATRALSWTATSTDAPWIASVTPSSGSSATPTDVAVTLDMSQLATLANGQFMGHINLAYMTEDGQSLQLPVTINLTLSLPRVQQVAPHVSYVGATNDLIVRGEGFASASGQSLLFGSMAVTGWQLVNDSEVTIGAPALPAGDVLVRFSNGLGIQTSAAHLLIQNAAALPAATVAATGNAITRVFYDDEHSILYAVEQGGALERFALQGTAWTTLSPIAVSNLWDASLSTDRQTLVLATFGSGIYELDLTTADASARQTDPDPQLFTSIAFTNHDLAILTTGIRGSGFTMTYTYDLTTKRATMFPGGMPGSLLSLGRAFASGDGRRVLLGQNGVSPPQPVIAYDGGTDRSQNTSISASVSDLALDRDGSRLVVNGASVYDASYMLLGQLGGGSSVALSPNGDRAYVYTVNPNNGAPTGIAAYDLTGQTDATGKFPVLLTITPSPSIQTGIGAPRMAISGDGQTLFARGNSGLQVIPLTTN